MPETSAYVWRIESSEELAGHTRVALVASAEFVADVQMWAERRNEERDAAIRDERERDAAQMQLASEQAAAGRELTEILAAHAHAQ